MGVPEVWRESEHPNQAEASCLVIFTSWVTMNDMPHLGHPRMYDLPKDGQEAMHITLLPHWGIYCLTS